MNALKISVLVAVTTLLLWAPPVFADDPDVEAASNGLEGTSLGGFAGYETDQEEPFLGAEARFVFDIDPSVALAVNPALNYFLISSDDYGMESLRVMQIDGNALFLFPLEGSVTPFAGAGLAIFYGRGCAFGFCDSETELGLNALGGLEIELDGSVDLFTQIRITRVTEPISETSMTGFALMGGVMVDL